MNQGEQAWGLSFQGVPQHEVGSRRTGRKNGGSEKEWPGRQAVKQEAKRIKFLNHGYYSQD